MPAMAPYGGPSSIGDVLTLIGAGLKDASPNSQGGNLMGAQQFLAQRAMYQRQQQMLAGLFPQQTPAGLFGGQAQEGQAAPQAPQQPQPQLSPGMTSNDDYAGAAGDQAAGVPAPPPTAALPTAAAAGPAGSPLSLDNKQLPAIAALYKTMGIDLGPSIEALKAQRPEMMATPDNTLVNKYDQRLAGKVFPKVGENQVVLRDSQGNPTGVINLPGAATAAGQVAGATTNAQEAAKAAYDLVPVAQSDGSTRLMPRSMALAALTGQTQGAGSGVAGDPAGGGAQLGVSQSPAAAALAKARAETQAQREQLQPKEMGALRDLDAASSLTSNTIHQILGDVRDPKTGQWTTGGDSMVKPWTVGIGANLKGISGTPAHDLDELLEHVNAATSMANLQNLRDNSPTGAGLGRVTQTEIGLLAAMNGSTDQGQRGPQFQQNMRRQLEQLDKAIANRRAVYQQTYGNIQQPTPGSTQPTAPSYSPKAQPAAVMPQVNEVRRGYRFVGGDPSKPASWAPVQ